MVAGDRFNLRQRMERIEALIAVLVAGPHLRGPGSRLKYWLLDDYPDREFDDIIDHINRLVSGADRAEKAAEHIARDGEQLRGMLSHFEEQIKVFNEHKGETALLQQETHAWLSLMSFGINVENVPVNRFLPVRAYLSEGGEGAIEKFTTAVTGLLHSLGLYQSDEFPEEKGSWYKKWFAKTADALTQPEIQNRLERMERALELQGLGKPQAEIDEKLGAALEKIANATASEKQVAVQIGSILYVKLTGPDGTASVAARSLSQAEMIALEKNQHLLMSPKDVFYNLYKLCHEPIYGGQTSHYVQIDTEFEDASATSSAKIRRKKASKGEALPKTK
ncbi:hypothetical protein [Rhizobium sp. BK377]|uniref:hypothetical protein n=1 Tax=Rhizobium sp. BK377 TaxID=2587058 RepID=UPI00161CE6B7|nr:hypothetical protein [Rhizobium sp. BK377]MBB3461202.1 hypothetical protein [Rhizobium sp. BK377]